MRALHAIVVGLALSVAACQSKPVGEMSYTELVAYTDDLSERCAAQGVTRSSPQFETCVRQEFLKDESMRNKSKQTRYALAAALDGAAGMQNSRPVSCTSSRSGSYVYTNCY